MPLRGILAPRIFIKNFIPNEENMNRVQPTPFIDDQIPAQQGQNFNKGLILGALAVALIAAPVMYGLYRASYSDVTQDLNISTTTPEQNMSYCQKFVAGITNIGGASFRDVSQLAEKHGIFGQRGLKDKLFQDCITVQKMGTSNDELAGHLEKIRLSAQFSGKLSYSPGLQANSTIGKPFRLQSLQLVDDLLTCNCVPIGKNLFSEAVMACRNPPIKNLHNNVQFRVTAGIIDRIRAGFYDGFDPVQVAAVLTGHSVNSINQAIEATVQKGETNNVLSSIVVAPLKWH